MPHFTHHGLHLRDPAFESPVIDVLQDLDRLVERGMLQPVEPNASRYVIGFAKGALLPAVIRR